MNEYVELRAFPANKVDALAIAYVSGQDLSDKSPEDVARLYNDVHIRIENEFKTISNEQKAAKPPYHSITGI